MNMRINKEKLINSGIPAAEAFKKYSFTKQEEQIVQEKEAYYEILMNIREIRKEKGLTQERLSQISGIPRTTIALIESGKRNATIDTLQSIARAMGKKIVVKLI